MLSGFRSKARYELGSPRAVRFSFKASEWEEGRCQFWCQLGFAVRALKLMPKLQLLGYDRLFAILARGEL
jgi:hypothetical protein